MSFNAVSSSSTPIEYLEWSLEGITKLKVNTRNLTNRMNQALGTNPLNTDAEAGTNQVLVNSYKDGRFVASESQYSSDTQTQLSEAIEKTLSEIRDNSSSTLGGKHTQATLEAYQSFLNNESIEVKLSPPSRSILLNVPDYGWVSGDVSTSLLGTTAKSCTSTKWDCFLKVRSKIADNGAVLLRNLFANAMQDMDFLRENVSQCYGDASMGCGMWRVQLQLKNQEKIGAALDEAVGASSYFRKASNPSAKDEEPQVLMGNKASWIFIVTAYKNAQNAVKLFISFVDDAMDEYTKNIAPLFTNVSGTSLKYLNPEDGKSGATKAFIGGTPFLVPNKQRLLGAASLDAYRERPLELSPEYAEDLWSEGSSGTRTEVMRFWVDLVQDKAGIKSFDALKSLRSEDIYSKLHPHITVSKECKIPLCSDTLMVLGLQSGIPDTNTMIRKILIDVLGYFVKKRGGKVAQYFFETKEDEDFKSLVNDTEHVFSKTILFDIMVGTYIHLNSDGFFFTNNAAMNLTGLILGTHLSAPMTIVCARAADLSIPSSTLEPTSEIDLVAAVRAHNSEVLGPLSSYAWANNDSHLRHVLDTVRGGLLRLAFNDYEEGESVLEKKARKKFFNLVQGSLDDNPGNPIYKNNKRTLSEAEVSVVSTRSPVNTKRQKVGYEPEQLITKLVSIQNLNVRPLLNNDKAQKLLAAFVRIFDDPWFPPGLGSYPFKHLKKDLYRISKRSQAVLRNVESSIEDIALCIGAYREMKKTYNYYVIESEKQELIPFLKHGKKWFSDKLTTGFFSNSQKKIDQSSRELVEYITTEQILILQLGTQLLNMGLPLGMPDHDKDVIYNIYAYFIKDLSEMNPHARWTSDFSVWCQEAAQVLNAYSKHPFAKESTDTLIYKALQNSIKRAFFREIIECSISQEKLEKFVREYGQVQYIDKKGEKYDIFSVTPYEENDFFKYGKTPRRPNIYESKFDT